ncbi:DNA translocase FtsK [Bartonella ancashensis]|uniref:Cell division protein FtsK n=1 Tax=Bartonella ancashensis TaxID=1318743 RepID=A0A0M4LRJ5_9HYPH|nr:DNA translocase FtsK [Bartonella ancashensis]ALE02834.1 Cell division protein FtsK [Bartonella ancashensis]
MRHLKTQSVSTSLEANKNTEYALEENSSDSTLGMFSYPTVWRKAFALGENVRFTRTPEVEILRRRIQTDPIFSKQFESFSRKKLQRFEKQVPPDKEIAQSPLVQEEDSIQSINHNVSFNYSAALGQSIQQTVSEVTNGYSEKYAPIVQERDVKQKTILFCYLSDDAFFEYESIIQEEENILVTQRVEMSVNSAENKVSLDNFSVYDASITTLYRILKCRFPHSSNAVTSDIFDAHFMKDKFFRGIQTQNTKSISGDDEDFELSQKSSTIDTVIGEVNEIESIVIDKGMNVFCEAIKSAKKGAGALSTMKEEGALQAIDTSSQCSGSAFALGIQSASYNSYEIPSVNLLREPMFQDETIISEEALEQSAGLLETVLEDFGIKGEIIHVHPGPVVTMYEFEPAAGVKSSRVIGLSDDIARSMSAISARVAVIPGRNVIGIELPNEIREIVYLRELIQSGTFCDSQFKLALALGKGINGEAVIAELVKMPHLLVAGTTGSGKSVAINTMILSILYRMTPEQCRLIMIDPKMLELSVYDGIPHLLTPVVTDPKKAVTALKWAVREMEERYHKMAKLGVRNIDGFNARIAHAVEKGETITCTVQSGFDKESGKMLYHEEAIDLEQLPYIVIIVDEMADLMMVAGKEIEGAIQRLAQMARAAGIHLIMATQRPSVDVITGTIKANFPTRISFQVTSKIDSRTILGEQGAETLLGQGDMLYMAGGGRIVRVHGPFVSDNEVEAVVAHLKMQGKPDYLATVTSDDNDGSDVEDTQLSVETSETGNLSDDNERLYTQAIQIVMRDKKCSTSYIQRRLSIGYNKAASLVERMEEEGIVGAANHVGKRTILCDDSN